ncbi:1-acyl-sn-glycerol-3-phosphate acyltransferase [Acidithiobacillus montserratensis]|uniref:1-acyl-sn-glycerol-3-phosphate acyltransferase n=1 Tax=Acidithiobacillus montserratensis TaxID=2729135 RepID=A0ACD5HJF7_9PROT|nr:1-acyl-sn-glycerol-3-phosphate acyltransferase [Acidithiobacillus montserratensis]
MPGHLILVRPHTSLLDGPVVARYLQQIGGHYGYLFAVDPDYARHPVYSRLLRWYGRLTGGHRMTALDQRSSIGVRRILRELEGHGRVVLFPQGTGIGDANRPDLPGADWLVRKSRCAVSEITLSHDHWFPRVIENRILCSGQAKEPRLRKSV